MEGIAVVDKLLSTYIYSDADRSSLALIGSLLIRWQTSLSSLRYSSFGEKSCKNKLLWSGLTGSISVLH